MKTNDELLKFYGVEIGKSYRVTKTYQGYENAIGEIFTITKDAQNLLTYWKKTDRCWSITSLNLYDYEECKELLDAEEKEYLKFIIKPFKKRAQYIIKTRDRLNDKEAYFISIYIDNDGKEDFICFPDFYAEANMYKNLMPGNKYTLEQLGLDE